MDYLNHYSISDNEVDELLRNAELRTELEPYWDEAIWAVNTQDWSLRTENEFFSLMLEWEQAPSLPISEWFNPPIDLPPADRLTDEELSVILEETLEQLYSKHIILDYSDHLNNRELYSLIATKILPLCEKMLDNKTLYHHWHCCSRDDDENLYPWLTYYASDRERADWSEQVGFPPPPQLNPGYPRGYSKKTS